jgi:hypothetical protein
MTALLKGALVELMPTFLGSLPNLIVFQYNPETMTHTWTQPHPLADPGTESGNPLAVKGMPGESFSFTLSLDGDDDIARGGAVAGRLAQGTGVYARLAALEMLLYPTASSGSRLLGTASAALSLGGAGFTTSPPSLSSADVTRTVPDSTVPVVLFVWGPGRIVPVRVTSLTVTEKLYDTALNPTHADVALALDVLTPEEIAGAIEASKVLGNVALTAYTYTLALRQALAVADLADTASSVIGMLPL